MPVAQCACGARYKVRDEWAGRKARCKKCGGTFQIPALPPQAPPPVGRSAGSGSGDPRGLAAETASASLVDQTGETTAFDPDAPRVSYLSRVRPRTGFWSDVGWTLLFFISPGNLAVFMVTWLLSVGAAFLGCFGWFIQAFIVAWYMSIIAETASGEDELPNFSISHGLVDDVLVPNLHYWLTWAVLFAPAFGYAVFVLATVNASGLLSPAGTDPYTVLTSSAATAPLAALVVLALFLWPAALMCVSMGGLGSLLRLDLIVRAVVSSFLPYLLIVLLVAAASIAPAMILQAAGVRLAGGVALGGIAAAIKSMLIFVVLASGVEVYFSIIAMRFIGLYYRHFKDRFPWDWE